MDKDGSGTMTVDEFSDALLRLGLGLTAVQVGEVLQAVDADGNGTVEYDEFIALLGHVLEQTMIASSWMWQRQPCWLEKWKSVTGRANQFPAVGALMKQVCHPCICLDP